MKGTTNILLQDLQIGCYSEDRANPAVSFYANYEAEPDLPGIVSHRSID